MATWQVSGMRWLCAAAFIMSASTLHAAQFAGGTGAPNHPYQIATPEQLIAVGKDPNLWDKHFVLTRDLDMKGIDPNAVQPIGDSEGNPFSGVFDGQGRTIANLRIVRKMGPWVGLFGQIGQAFMKDVPPGHVRNLHLRNISVVGKDAVGALAGELSAGTIKNCSVTGVVVGKGIVGGLVGWGHGEVVSCTAAVEVHGEENVGGLIGDMSGIVTHCSSSGSVRGRTRVGGLIGTDGFAAFFGSVPANNRPEVSEYTNKTMQCCSDCSVAGDEEVGGLIGAAVGAGAIQDCHALGPVDGRTQVGGLIGTTVGCCISRCFSAGQVKGKEHTGGLIGKNEPVRDVEKLVTYPPCQFVVEQVKGPSSETGWKWLLVYRPAIQSCFWDAEASGMTRGLGAGADAQGGITRLTTTEMRTAAAFKDFGWDFEEVWAIQEGKAYPRLRWEVAPNRNKSR